MIEMYMCEILQITTYLHARMPMNRKSNIYMRKKNVGLRGLQWGGGLCTSSLTAAQERDERLCNNRRNKIKRERRNARLVVSCLLR